MLILSRIFLSTIGIINTIGINIFSKKIFLTYQPSLNIFYLDLFVLSLPHIVYIAKLPKPKLSICVNKEEPPSHKHSEA